MVFDGYRHSLFKNNSYCTTEKNLLHKKEETRSKPRRMKPHLWKLEYNINNQGTQFVYVLYM